MADALCVGSCTVEGQIWKSVCRCWQFFTGQETFLFGSRLEETNTFPDERVEKKWAVSEFGLLNVPSMAGMLCF